MVKRVITMLVVGALLSVFSGVGVLAEGVGGNSTYWESPSASVLQSYLTVDSNWTADAQMLVGESLTFKLLLNNGHDETVTGQVTFKVLVDSTHLTVEREIESMGSKFWIPVELDITDAAILVTDYAFTPGTTEITLRVTFKALGTYRFAAWVDIEHTPEE